ncbi:LytR C-terminal domain-containing protein, partial [Sphingomonas astaxanthinifaciens]
PAATAPLAAPAPSVSLPIDRASDELRVAERPFSGPRLERVSLAEMILVTSPATRLPVRVAEAGPSRPAPARPAPRLAAILPVPLKAAPAPVRVINAARVTRLAANTRSQLQSWGWRTVAIANAPAAAERSAILFPERRRKEAQQLGRRLGIDLHMQVAGQGGELVVRLGRDMARRRISA